MAKMAEVVVAEALLVAPYLKLKILEGIVGVSWDFDGLDVEW